MSTPLRVAVGRHLRQIRKDLGLDQTHVADQVGVTQSTWSRIERGESALNIDQLEKAALALNVPVAQIFTDCRE